MTLILFVSKNPYGYVPRILGEGIGDCIRRTPRLERYSCAGKEVIMRQQSRFTKRTCSTGGGKEGYSVMQGRGFVLDSKPVLLPIG